MVKFKQSDKDSAIQAKLDKHLEEKPAKQSPIQAAREGRRIVTGWNEKQIAHLETLWGKPITSSKEAKEAIREITGMPEDDKAGAPEGNKNRKVRKAKPL